MAIYIVVQGKVFMANYKLYIYIPGSESIPNTRHCHDFVFAVYAII